MNDNEIATLFLESMQWLMDNGYSISKHEEIRTTIHQGAEKPYKTTTALTDVYRIEKYSTVTEDFGVTDKSDAILQHLLRQYKAQDFPMPSLTNAVITCTQYIKDVTKELGEYKLKTELAA